MDMKMAGDGKGKLGSGEAAGIWLLLAMVSHTAWGGYPVLVRYLQHVHRMPTMGLSAATNLLAFVILFIWKKSRIDFRVLGVRDFLLFGGVVAVRGLTNIYGPRLTFATTVQLFSLLSPFVVALLGKKLLGESLPKFTVAALLCSLAGSLFMVLGGPVSGGVGGNDPLSNWIGIFLSFFGGILMAFLMMDIKLLTRKGASAETLAITQFGSMALFMSVGSIMVGEPIDPWFHLPVSGIAAFLAFALIVILSGTMLQNRAVDHLGAASYSTMQAWRLAATIAISWLLLGEGIDTVWQGVGALIVMATVTLYMVSQKRERDREMAATQGGRT
jgi:drug/metabolite transporter (DMT)-like permease